LGVAPLQRIQRLVQATSLVSSFPKVRDQETHLLIRCVRDTVEQIAIPLSGLQEILVPGEVRVEDSAGVERILDELTHAVLGRRFGVFERLLELGYHRCQWVLGIDVLGKPFRDRRPNSFPL